MRDLLARLDAALARMRARGHAASPHYQRLAHARTHVAAAMPYTVRQVAPELIGTVGSLIPRTNVNLKNERIVRQQRLDVARMVDAFRRDLEAA